MDQFTIKHAESIRQVAEQKAKQKLNLGERHSKIFEILGMLAEMPEDELIDFELFESMFTIRLKRLRMQFLNDLHDILGGQLSADPDDTGLFEVGKAGLLWAEVHVYTDLLEDKQIPFPFLGDQS